MIAEILLGSGRDELEAHSGLVYLLENDGLLRLAAYFGHPAERVQRWQSVPRDPHHAGGSTSSVAACRRSGSRAWTTCWPAYPVVGEVEGSGERSLAAVRLSHGANTVGAAFWTFDVARRFNDADRGFLELIAEQAAAAIGRARATADAATITAATARDRAAATGHRPDPAGKPAAS